LIHANKPVACNNLGRPAKKSSKNNPQEKKPSIPTPGQDICYN
jgi:hypothetical protein